ncbi:MAG TPA: hypothetical protein VHB93_02320 [Candidatus Paceibacterota bacterium]|nr:hypothetical protein [Candidatus Paceibacterota bacterium]
MKNLLGSAIVATVLSISFNTAIAAGSDTVVTRDVHSAIQQLNDGYVGQSFEDTTPSDVTPLPRTVQQQPASRVQKAPPPPVVAQTPAPAPAPVATAPSRTYNYNVAKAAPVQQPPVQQYAQQQLPRVELRPAGQRHVLRDGVMVDVDVMCVYIGNVRGDCMDQQAHAPYGVPTVHPRIWNAGFALLGAPPPPRFVARYDYRRDRNQRHNDLVDMRDRGFRGHSGLRVRPGWHHRGPVW